MRQAYEPQQPSPFPRDLEYLWGKTVIVNAMVRHRGVTEFSGKGGKLVKMPQLDIQDLHIAGYDQIIPHAIISSPVLWKSGVKAMDVLTFQAMLIKGKGGCVAFSGVKNVKSYPYFANQSFEEVQCIG